MSKYKIVSIINLILGIIQMFSSAILYWNYRDLLFTVSNGITIGVDYQVNNVAVYSLIAFMLIMALINFFLGIKGLLRKVYEENWFKYKIIFIIVSFILTGIVSVLFNISTLLPLYRIIT
jgi:hypothetical protein